MMDHYIYELPNQEVRVLAKTSGQLETSKYTKEYQS